MFQGDEVAGIAADTEERSYDIARLVRVRYEQLPHFANVEQAMAPDAPKVFAMGNTRDGNREEAGDLDAGFKQAAHVVEQTYSTHVITHCCLETHGTVCEWDGDKLTAWVSTQGVHASAQQYADGLKIPQANVRVITQYMGGGFGSKTNIGAEGLICARLAQAGESAGQVDAGPQRGAAGGRQPSVGDRAHSRRRLGGRRVSWPSTVRAGARAARARRRISRCPTSTTSRTAGARTRTSTSTPVCSAPCARRAIRRGASSPKS